MSYAAAGHLQLRLTERQGLVELTMRHRVLGMIDDAHRDGVTSGWAHFLSQVKRRAES